MIRVKYDIFGILESNKALETSCTVGISREAVDQIIRRVDLRTRYNVHQLTIRRHGITYDYKDRGRQDNIGTTIRL